MLIVIVIMIVLAVYTLVLISRDKNPSQEKLQHATIKMPKTDGVIGGWTSVMLPQECAIFNPRPSLDKEFLTYAWDPASFAETGVLVIHSIHVTSNLQAFDDEESVRYVGTFRMDGCQYFVFQDGFSPLGENE